MNDSEIVMRLDAISTNLDSYICRNDTRIDKVENRVECIEKIQQSEAVHKAEFEMEVSTKLDNILENQAIKEERIKTASQNNTLIKVAVITTISSLAVGLLALIRDIFF